MLFVSCVRLLHVAYGRSCFNNVNYTMYNNMHNNIIIWITYCAVALRTRSLRSRGAHTRCQLHRQNDFQMDCPNSVPILYYIFFFFGIFANYTIIIVIITRAPTTTSVAHAYRCFGYLNDKLVP